MKMILTATVDRRIATSVSAATTQANICTAPFCSTSGLVVLHALQVQVYPDRGTYYPSAEMTPCYFGFKLSSPPGRLLITSLTKELVILSRLFSFTR